MITWNKNGEKKMKPNSKIITGLSIISIIIGVFLVLGISIKNNTRIIRYQTRKETQEQIKFLRDSFEMEYYKKQLETYPFDHSKIPTNGK